MIMVTAVMHVVPNRSYQKYIRLFTGMILVLLLCTPVFKLLGMDQENISVINIEEFEDKIKEIEESTRYLYEINVSEHIADEEQEHIETQDIKIEKIEIGE